MQQRRDDPQFIQQHLANERTYLAWVRTSIAIIGLGFLSAGLTFQHNRFGVLGHLMITVGGIGGVLMGTCVLAWATRDFFVKRRGINARFFRSPSALIWFVFLSLGLISITLIVLVIMMLL